MAKKSFLRKAWKRKELYAVGGVGVVAGFFLSPMLGVGLVGGYYLKKGVEKIKK